MAKLCNLEELGLVDLIISGTTLFMRSLNQAREGLLKKRGGGGLGQDVEK